LFNDQSVAGSISQRRAWLKQSPVKGLLTNNHVNRFYVKDHWHFCHRLAVILYEKQYNP